jgi:hypothetical protein
MAGLLQTPLKALELAQKHPLALAGAGAAVYGTNEALNRAEDVEQAMLNNRQGAPMGKYVYAELDAFEQRKGYLDEKLAFEKNANVVFENQLHGDANHPEQGSGIAWAPTMGSELAGGFGKAIGQQTIGGIASLLGSVADHLRDKIVLAPKREAIFSHLVENDPVISQYEAAQPGSAARAYMSMSRFAPELSTDPNVVTSFLREAAQTGGTLNHVMIKQLAEAEAAIQAAKGEWRR